MQFRIQLRKQKCIAEETSYYVSVTDPTSGPDNPPESRPEFTTARALFNHHLKVGLAQGLGAKAAKCRAKKMYCSERITLMEPQWKTRQSFQICTRCSLDHKSRTCEAIDPYCDYCNVTGHVTAVCQMLHRFCFR
jgi:hypothetical protein